MSSIVSKSTLTKLENLRKYVLKSAIWVLVGAVAVGAFAILLGGSESGTVMLKFMGTLFIVASMMMVSVRNFRLIAIEKAEVQVFALIGLFSDLLCAPLWILLCWNPEWIMEKNNLGLSSNDMSMLTKFAWALLFLSALGSFCSDIMNMYEGTKKNAIRPLKITAVVCIIYEMLYIAVIVFVGGVKGELATRLGLLAGFVGVAWLFVAAAAFVLSRNEKNAEAKKTSRASSASEQPEAPGKPATPKSEDELRAEIEEKVRREMIEKEVREKLEAEQAAKESPKE